MDRVQLLYDAGGTNRELPFVVGVLADLAGHRDAGPRRFLPIDRDDYPDVLAKLAPELRLTLPAPFGPVSLRFRDLDDFGPAAVAAQVPALGELLHARKQLHDLTFRTPSDRDVERLLADLARRGDQVRALAAEMAPGAAAPAAAALPPGDGASLLAEMLGGPVGPAAPATPVELGDVDQLIRHALASTPTVSRSTLATLERWTTLLDDRLTRGLRLILHHPDFQRLEAAWRGLWYLVRRVDTGENLKIRVLNIRKAELLAGPGELLRRIYTDVYESDGEPFGLLVGDYEFGPDDADGLAKVAAVAELAHAPFVAAAAPGLLGLQSFAELPDAEDLADRARSESLAKWNAFRDTPASRYVALTAPRVLARRPYGKDHAEVEEFAFEELADDPTAATWMSAAWAYGVAAATTFDHFGWFLRMAPAGDLPSFVTEIDGESGVVGPTEVRVSERIGEAVADLGVLPVGGRGDSAAFFGFQACRRPQSGDGAHSDDEYLAQLPVLLCVSRVAQYLLVQSQALRGARPSADALTAYLNDWLSRYADDDGHAPLRAGGVQVRAAAGKLAIAAVLRLTGGPLLPLRVGSVRGA